MIVENNNIRKYLEDYQKGLIEQGLTVGCELDDYIRFKKGSFNMILGHDNVGKTYWRTWYYLVLSIKYDLKWCIWTGENQAGQIVRNLIKIYAGKDPKKMTLADLYRYEAEISQWFTFVDNSKLYKYDELLSIFKDKDYNGCLIDPYTGLDRKYGHSDNYEFLNETRQWVNQTGVTIDVCTHPVSASGRGNAVYPQGHAWEGHIRNPFKSDVEGGKPFANRCDDFIVLHRIVKSETMRNYTLVYVEKIKDVDTGGSLTTFDNPIMCEFNSGYGFKIGGINPLKEQHLTDTKPLQEGYQQKPLTPSNQFEKTKEELRQREEEEDKYSWMDNDPDELDF